MSDPHTPALRIGDRERDRTLRVLSVGLAHGHLEEHEHAERAHTALRARTHRELDFLTADLPAPPPEPGERAEQDRKDLKDWLAEWRYWLGGAVIMNAIWGARSIQEGELTRYWPVIPLGIWAAVLVTIALWPREEDGRNGEDGVGEGGTGDTRGPAAR